MNDTELIPITENGDGSQSVTGRDLHNFLEIKTQYYKWLARMVEYGFAEGQDYVVKPDQVADSLGRLRGRSNHILTLEMAKRISSLHRTYAGERALAYLADGKELPAKRVDRPESLVYFIEAPDVDMVKIGISIDVESRFRSLQSMSPTRISLLATEKGGSKRENRLHRMFADHRSHGEWFHMAPEIETYIESLTAGKELSHV